MRGGFRFESPTVPAACLVRPRLLALLQERWQRRLTVVVAGAGFGKTTLLTQAVIQNRLAPFGRDLWLGCEPEDGAADQLGAGLAQLLGARGPRSATPRVWAETLAEQVWAAAPGHVALLLDDLHVLPAASPGLELVDELLGALPANGHLVVTARTTPALRMARLVSRGEVCSVSEHDLALTGDEIEELARRHGVSPESLAANGGWPALAALAAVAGHVVPDYLWEEVLGRLPAERRRLLALLARIGGADDEVLAAVAAEPLPVEAVVTDLPLVARAPDGWCSLHPLWEGPLAGEVSDLEATEACRRAAGVLRGRHNYTRAVSMLASAHAWPEALGVMAEACGTSTPLAPLDVLEGWAALVPEADRHQPEFHLLTGTIAEAGEPARAVAELDAAVAGFCEQGKVEAELVAMAHLGQVAQWQQDPLLMAKHMPRIFELEVEGLPMATTLACLARALMADEAGDHARVLEELDRIPTEAIDDRWIAIAEWIRAVQLVDLGQPEQAETVARRAAGRVAWAAPVLLLRTARWLEGDVDAVVAESGAVVAAVAASGLSHYVAGAAASAARAHAFAGSLSDAVGFLEQARKAAIGPQPLTLVGLATAEAACAVAAGEEARAAQILGAELAALPLQAGQLLRVHRVGFPLTYVLVPETRGFWDDAALPPHYETDRELARTVVALRETGSVERARRLVWPGAGRVRAVLPAPWSVELAVGLAGAGRPEAAELIAAVGPVSRQHLRALGKSSRRPLARAAQRLLAQVPATPGHQVEVRVLGPLEVSLDGQTVQGELRRERVRALLSFLVMRGATTRERAAAAMWPEHDDAAAANNLRVTLSYLLRVLEPGRGDGEPSCFVAQDPRGLRLVEHEALRVDAWECERLLDEAADAEAQGAPSLALDAYRRALALVRGDYLADVGHQDWALPEQNRVRIRLVAAAVRAGELLVAAGQPSEARELAEHALVMEPWSEPAYRVVAAAHLAAGDRAAALRALAQCRAMLDELDAEPEPATVAVERAVAAGRDDVRPTGRRSRAG